ncbi:unnamed protein product [Cuscuta campestris]|uniref:Beta-glucuronosyltransferase GlcAT14A n=1 Tax=Cuscuta campestris TaxID=132261 RepID=A0A484L9X5_9ASTE|nr:unnamed protein product [Cuscuta campestris]
MYNQTQPYPTANSGSTATARLLSTPFILVATFFVSLLLIVSLLTLPSRPPLNRPDTSIFPNRHPRPHRVLIPGDQSSPPPSPPSIAYYISGSAGDSDRILRLLYAVYHPRNHYLLHLDRSAPQADRDYLAFAINAVPLFRAAQNVYVMGKANFVYSKGSSSISSVLHGASILLRILKSWDWFINLSSADYPLVTQDDLLHILSYLPKELNFVNHTSYIGWRESQKLKPIIVDPGLYLAEDSEIFYATQRRPLPDAFRVFSGSSSFILSRKFIEYCILGTENLPRTLLMYLANAPSSNSIYFPTILCNSRSFNRTIVNNNLQYVPRNSRMEAGPLNSSDFASMIRTGAAFASPFQENDPILDKIDSQALHRSPGKPVPGGWCLGDTKADKCAVWGDADILRPGIGAKRLEKHFISLFADGKFQSQQCLVE